METTGSYIENLPEVNLDVGLAYGDSETAGHANLNVLPDLLVLPSKLKPFVKVKGEGGREGQWEGRERDEMIYVLCRLRLVVGGQNKGYDVS